MAKRKNIVEKEKLLDYRKMWAIFQKNFVVITRDKTRFLPLLLFPIFMIVVFGYTSGTAPKHISMGVIDYDNSPLSSSIIQEISNSDTFSIKKMLSTEGEGKKLMDRGDISVLVEIPPNLERDVNNGIPASITVLVDESDSSVAGTSKQMLNLIINKVSYGIGAKKIEIFQSSVGEAGNQLNAYISQNVNSYGTIASKTSAADSTLMSAKEIIDYNVMALSKSLSPPSPLFFPSSYKNNNVNYSASTVIVPITAAYSATQAQIASLSGASALMAASSGNIHSAGSIAAQSDAAYQQTHEYQYYYDNVVVPEQQISNFKNYNTNALLQPLSYNEKPAYGTGKQAIDFLIPSIIALTIFQGAVMGMGRAVAGEKREGSLTRVFLTPTSNVTIILGTLLFYIIFEVFRSSFLILIAMSLFHIKIEGSLIAIGAILVVYAGVSTGIGMFLSSLVNTEQQYMGVSMLVSMPTLFLAGAFFPIESMPKFLQGLAGLLPVTYAGDALRGVMIKGFSLATIWYPLLMLCIFLAVTLGAVFMVFKREID